MDIEANLQKFLTGVQPQERYASFDYCYNYFQLFHEQGSTASLASSENMQQSCLQLGFYLASWGMLRGSSFLLGKSAKFYEPLIDCVANTDPIVWKIDADNYTEENIAHLVKCEHQFVKSLSGGGWATGTLVTKIMLGVFGNVPAFDTYFVQGTGIRWSGEKAFSKALRQVDTLYQNNKAVIDSYQITTFDFVTGGKTHRLYPKAKIIDMAGFVQGQN